ncbi:DUF4112 domain-containing protein [Profundibacterium mesophilum]|uniref:DUF4112 domain-containing protein n=1 Tax=Profundibacterium mesophilum KAUST100406-0324 TaxID=1037889 RepID=A0A921TB59_9RHOB|nr:DUF4112 domain-containing protein [Profundibacterium mesophilum]KAF0674940.1 hypothetical protein PMES_02648 [Profundibacterium mesophilum KAUST100406-0324]
MRQNPARRPHPEAHYASSGDTVRRLERLDRLATQMDSALRIPGTSIRLGWDSILGLVPGVGDALALAPGAYIVMESHRLGAPRGLLVKQGVNVAIDAVIGTIPVIGDLFDVGFKANRRNVALLKDHFERNGPGTLNAAATTDPGMTDRDIPNGNRRS